MKPITRTGNGNLDVQKGDKLVAMTIDANALAHVMDVLTNLYSNQTLAVIREYSTNAYDAHVEAGIEAPIEVTLPTKDHLFFRVRDYGLGMDAQDIEDVYSKYGASTKRDSDDVVGMLGMGCKSALAYTNEFYVTGIKNGIRTQVNVTLAEDGIPYMNIVDESPTAQRSGVEITVPVEPEDVEDFQEEAKYFYRYWQAGVLVDGEVPEQIEGIWLQQDKLMLTKDHNNHNIVVMGNVPYPVTGYIYGDDAGFVAYVEIGDVEFTPAREALKDTPRTLNTIAHIKATVASKRDELFTRMIANAKTGYEAVQTLREAKQYGFKLDGMWQGERIPATLIFNDGKDREIRAHMVESRKQYRRRRAYQVNEMNQNKYATAYWLTGFKNKNFTPSLEAKFDLWKQAQNDSHEVYYLVTEIPAEYMVWLDPKMIGNWDDVKAIKLPRQSNGSTPTGPAAYDGMDQDGGFYAREADEIRGENLFYRFKSDENNYPNRDLLDHYYNEWTVVTIGKNQLGKLQRLFPDAMSLVDRQRDLRKTWLDKLTEDDRLYFTIQSSLSEELYAKLDMDRIDDPEVKRCGKLLKRKNHRLENEREIHAVVVERVEFEDPMDKYLLVKNLRSWNINKDMLEHMYPYMNAIYAEMVNPS